MDSIDIKPDPFREGIYSKVMDERLARWEKKNSRKIKGKLTVFKGKKAESSFTMYDTKFVDDLIHTLDEQSQGEDIWIERFRHLIDWGYSKSILKPKKVYIVQK